MSHLQDQINALLPDNITGEVVVADVRQSFVIVTDDLHVKDDLLLGLRTDVDGNAVLIGNNTTDITTLFAQMADKASQADLTALTVEVDANTAAIALLPTTGDLALKLDLAGGTVTGDLVFGRGIAIRGTDSTDTPQLIMIFDTNDKAIFGSNAYTTEVRGLEVSFPNTVPTTAQAQGALDNELTRKDYVDTADAAIQAQVTINTDDILALEAGAADKEAVGSVKLWASATVPNGWLECNGTTMDSALNPQLQDLVDILNPGGNTTAVLPETRGEFVRGWDNTRGVDAARAILSAQADEFKSHVHKENYGLFADMQPGTSTQHTLNTTTETDGVDTEATGGAETRPRNTAMMYIIKAFNVATDPQPPEFQINNYLTNKNYIINPTIGLINQRGFAGGVLSANQYGVDRWKEGAGATADITISNGEMTINSGQIIQLIEDFGYIGLITLSWAGTATGGINGDGTGTSNTSPYSFDVSAGDIGVQFTNGTLKNVKLEIGSVATPFEYPDAATELAKCQRYYEVIYVTSRWGNTNVGEFNESHVTFTPKRALPIVTLDSTGSVNLSDANLIPAESYPYSSARLGLIGATPGDAHLLLAKATLDAEL